MLVDSQYSQALGTFRFQILSQTIMYSRNTISENAGPNSILLLTQQWEIISLKSCSISNDFNELL